jgi:5-methylcytosine-specific restriction endonuclease McrA
MRTRIPNNIRSQILLTNKHLCCVCREGGLQIHHINSDASDNSLENLSVLCLKHHDMATAPRGMTARLKPEEIRKYKNSWEEECSKSSHLIARSRTAFFMVDYKNAERIRQLLMRS